MLTRFLDPDSNITDNYLMTCDRWRETFRAMDKDELAGRFHLKQDADALYITYYSEEYRLDRATGMVTLTREPELLPCFNTAISIYNLFYYSKPGAKVRGEFVPFRPVKRASPFAPAFQKNTLEPLARMFTGQTEALHRACQRLGGRPIPQGDAGYVVDAFAWMPLTVVFWDADDEFDAQANILFDADITDFIHEETVCCIAGDLIRRLSEEAGLLKNPQ